MPDFTAQIGTFDFAPYVRVAPGEGLDPYDSGGFEEPAFTSSPFSEGSSLANVDVGNREMVFPLYLNDASKDELHALVRDLNRAIRYPTGQLTLEWQDVDASLPTFFDVAYARFDPEFSLRQASQGWLAGVLRVYAAGGYGHTGTYRVVGTAVGVASHNILTEIAVPTLSGDAPAEIQAFLSVATKSWSGFSSFQAVSVLPHGWVSEVPAASMSGGSLAAMPSIAIHGQARRAAAGGSAAAVLTTIPLPRTNYQDRSRMLLAVQSSASAFVVSVSIGITGDTYVAAPSATVVVAPERGAASQGVCFVDIGAYAIPTALPSAGISVFMRAEGATSGSPTQTFAVNHLVMLPEEATLLSRARGFGFDANSPTYTFSPQKKHRRYEQTVATVPVEDYLIDGRCSGAMPYLNSGVPSQRLVGMIAPAPASTDDYIQDTHDHPAHSIRVDFRVRERFQFAR